MFPWLQVTNTTFEQDGPDWKVIQVFESVSCLHNRDLVAYLVA